MKELPVRKHPRLTDYDYSAKGAYFITFCVKDRHELLGKLVGRDAPGAPTSKLNAPGAPTVKLSEHGRIIDREIMKTPSYYTNVFIDKHVVMPNHVHMIIIVADGAPKASNLTTGAPGASRPTMLIPSIISAIKRKTNKAFGFDMWQTSYHDHIIRNEDEYNHIWHYIDENPAKWAEDEYYGA